VVIGAGAPLLFGLFGVYLWKNKKSHKKFKTKLKETRQTKRGTKGKSHDRPRSPARSKTPSPSRFRAPANTNSSVSTDSFESTDSDSFDLESTDSKNYMTNPAEWAGHILKEEFEDLRRTLSGGLDEKSFVPRALQSMSYTQMRLKMEHQCQKDLGEKGKSEKLNINPGKVEVGIAKTPDTVHGSTSVDVLSAGSSDPSIQSALPKFSCVGKPLRPTTPTLKQLSDKLFCAPHHSTDAGSTSMITGLTIVSREAPQTKSKVKTSESPRTPTTTNVSNTSSFSPPPPPSQAASPSTLANSSSIQYLASSETGTPTCSSSGTAR
jgi:hypothetical protein